MSAPSGPRRPPIVPDRVRRIEGGFCFVPHRFLRDGFFVSLTQDELSLYLLLVLAGDRCGVSFYHYDSLCSLLEMPLETFLAARNGLIDKDLVAFDGTRFQVLSLPPRPVLRTRRPISIGTQLEEDDPATVRDVVRRGLRCDGDPHDH